MSVQKIRNLGGVTTGKVPSLLTSMKAGHAPSEGPGDMLGHTPSFYDSQKIGHAPSKSGQAPNQKLIDTMHGVGKGKK